jgi:hypothetical protein
VKEMIVLLRTFEKTGDWDRVRKQAYQDNLLRKGSSHTVESITREAKRRFFNSSLGLPRPEQVGAFFAKRVPESAKEQVAFVFLCESDSLVKRVVLALVAPRLTSSGPKLSHDDVLAFLREEGASHPELARWTDYLKKRWARGMLAVLRDFGLMEAAPSQRLLVPSVRPETFMFFAQWFIDNGLPRNRIAEHPLWKDFVLSRGKVEDLLVESHRRGWISYARAGDILEIRPRFSSVEDWIGHGLG